MNRITNRPRQRRFVSADFAKPGGRLMARLLVVLVLCAGYWLLPISGQVLILTDSAQKYQEIWPQMWVEPPAARPGEILTLYVRDNAPWSYVKIVVDGSEMPRDETYVTGKQPWTWRWRFTMPEEPGVTAVFYHDCHTGCIERTHMMLGVQQFSDTPMPAAQPTKLGVVFADPARNWHGRAGWAVELTYAQRQADDVDFSIDGLARRARQATQLGLRVLVRVDYDRQQSLPPGDDEVALEQYLAYCARLVRDDRLNDVYGYVIGAGYNAASGNILAPQQPTTPEWYARVFNGYGLTPTRGDNVVQIMRAIDPRARILIGPVAPWNSDQNGVLVDPHNLPWLNYMNTLVAHIDQAAWARQMQGIPLAGPDGFALRTPGRIDSLEVAEHAALEPSTDLHRQEWGAAQAGFRVYQDWLAIINRYPTTRGLPAYITSTNIVTSASQAPPVQTYPSGWLTTALHEIDREPQIQALCWFVDQPLGDLWNDFSLSRHPGKLNDAATEFDQLLQR